MIVRKKDWIALQDRLASLEAGHKTLVQVVNGNAGQMADNYSDTRKVTANLANLLDSVLSLRATVFGLMAKIKNCFGDSEVYTQTEIEKMSSSEYANKVLRPLGVSMSSTTLFS